MFENEKYYIVKYTVDVNSQVTPMFSTPNELRNSTFTFLMSEKAYATTNYNVKFQQDGDLISFDTNYGGAGKIGTWYLFFKVQ